MEKTRAKTNVKTKKSEGAARQNQVIAVVIKQYATGLYRACVSLHRDDVTFLSSHKDERSANETINLFWRAYDEGRLQTREDLAAFVKVIQRRNAAPTDPQPVPPLPPRPAVSSMPPAAPRPAMPQRPAVSSMPPRVQMPPTSPVPATPQRKPLHPRAQVPATPATPPTPRRPPTPPVVVQEAFTPLAA